jgi:hypothetical protein
MMPSSFPKKENKYCKLLRYYRKAHQNQPTRKNPAFTGVQRNDKQSKKNKIPPKNASRE